VFLEQGKSRTYSFRLFKTIAGDDVTMAQGGEGAYTRPSETGFALIRGTNPTEGYVRDWVVNLLTLIGIPLPFDKIFDATFSPDGKWVYVAHADGISRISLPTLDHVELVTNIINTSWGVNFVKLSPSLRYALVSGTADTQLIYKIPTTN
jgi:hypothetical protein